MCSLTYSPSGVDLQTEQVIIFVPGPGSQARWESIWVQGERDQTRGWDMWLWHPGSASPAGVGQAPVRGGVVRKAEVSLWGPSLPSGGCLTWFSEIMWFPLWLVLQGNNSTELDK